jgi:predicted anti-sigma-YlaC factor YlaD
MSNKHLTDEELQAFLLKEVQDESISEHLATCASCQKKVNEYQQLIVGVSKFEAETFSFDVTKLVMQKIEEVETQKEKNKNWILYISLTLISLVILIFAYPYLKLVFAQLKSFLLIEIGLILTIVLGVTIFLLHDLSRQYKQKEMLLLQ